MITPIGWNTWDANHLNAFVHLPSRLRVRFCLYHLGSHTKKEIFDWRAGMRRLGPHASDGSYNQVDLRWDALTLSCEYGHPVVEEPAPAICRFIAAEGSMADEADYLLLVELDGAWAAPVQVSQGNSSLAAQAGGVTWQLTANHAPLNPLPEGMPSATPFLAFAIPPAFQEWEDEPQPVDPILIKIEPVGVPPVTFEEAARRLDDERKRYQATALRGMGWLDEAAAGMTRGLHWNTIWEPVKRRICTPVSRDWCRVPGWGGYVLFDWDTFFAAMMSGLEDPSLAEANVRAILQEITPAGFVPNFGSARATSQDRSQPPVGSYVVLKLASSRSLVRAPQWLNLLSEVYPALLRWHRWWMPHRDGNGDGLLEWGSTPTGENPGWEAGTLRAAMYESGLDNSPMYDSVVFNQTTHTMELVDVGLNALYALDAWALAQIAAILGLEADASALTDEYQQMGERINSVLWNEAAGIYQNKSWDGRFSPSLSPTNFYPLLAGIVPLQRARRMVDEHLLNSGEFWGGFVLPSISRGDPGYRSSERRREGLQSAVNDYWRGRIWGPMNFLVCEGLRRYGFDLEALALSQKSLDLFLGEWRGESHVHENYDDISGDGDNAPNSDPVYHWGGLLAYLGIQELADFEPWKGWRFGNLGEGVSAIKGIRLVEGELAVAVSPAGLRLSLNDLPVLTTDQPVILRGVEVEPAKLSGELVTGGPEVELTLYGFKPGQSISIRAGQTRRVSVANPEGQVTLKLAKGTRFEAAGSG